MRMPGEEDNALSGDSSEAEKRQDNASDWKTKKACCRGRDEPLRWTQSRSAVVKVASQLKW